MSPPSCLRYRRSHFWEAGSSSSLTDHLYSFFLGQREMTHIYDCFAAAPLEWLRHQPKYNLYFFQTCPSSMFYTPKKLFTFFPPEVLKTIQPQQRFSPTEIRNIFQSHKGKKMINQLIFVMYLDIWWFVCSKTVIRIHKTTFSKVRKGVLTHTERRYKNYNF